jgi:hypothetical protein
MSSSAQTAPSAQSTSASSPIAAPRRRKPMRMTPAKLRAQRANARLSTGPRTAAGLRRSALNRRRLKLSPVLSEHLKWRGADLAEVRRLWQDVLAVFWFADRDCYQYLQWAACSWWRKLQTLRAGGSEADVKYVDAEIEKYLRQVVGRFAKSRQRWEHWLRKEIGADVQQGMATLRVAVEGKLGTFRGIAV